MVRITIDEELQKKLLSAGEVVELVDASGKLLGRVLPEVDDFPNGWVAMTPELSDEELDQLSKVEGPTITSEELMARLRAKR